VRVVAEPLGEVTAAIEATLRSPERHALCLCPVDAHSVLEARKDQEVARFLDEAAFTVPDGMPLVRVARWTGFPRAERARGADLMWRILEGTSGTEIRHFFYGGRDGVADALASRVAGAFPGVRVAGTFCPPFRPLTSEEERDVVQRIHASGADVVWVGLSTPGQHRWAARMRSRLDVKLIGVVGAAFDYHTGALRPAPAWMQAASLEWLYRLAQEPRRLGRRYLEVVPGFVWLVGVQMLTGRRHDRG
jgi:N-acetylglucosaminyldiphosphoundecaprenol N-acetyl-beta-D-mannosaminyltransferase